MSKPGSTGFQPRNTPAERRAFFDLKRTIGDLEGGVQGPPGPPGQGVPPGGTPPQVLTKVGPNNYETAWQDPPSGGGGGTDEVMISLTQPPEPNTLEIWYDPDAVAEAIVGPPGPAGEDGTQWFDGPGPPVEPVPGANAGDYYLETSTGNVWQLTAV